MGVLNIGIGFMMLVAGRPIYAVFVGGMGFLLANFLIAEFNFIPSNWNVLTFTLMIALIGVFSANIFKHWMTRVACFLAGIFLVYELMFCIIHLVV